MKEKLYLSSTCTVHTFVIIIIHLQILAQNFLNSLYMLIIDKLIPNSFAWRSVLYTAISSPGFIFTEVHYSSEEYESLSEDDDFLIVPMPACFDFSKPVIKPQVSESSSDNETTDNNHNLLDDNHNTIVTSKLSVIVYRTLCVCISIQIGHGERHEFNSLTVSH